MQKTSSNQLQKLTVTSDYLKNAQESLASFVEGERNQHSLAVAICEGIVQDLTLKRTILQTAIATLTDESN